MKTNETGYWETTDPDVTLALCPSPDFPFQPSKWSVINEKPDVAHYREELEQARALHGQLPADYIEVILFIDCYTFKGSVAYSGAGICFRLVPTRAELERFYQELNAEYQVFRECCNVQKQNEQIWAAN